MRERRLAAGALTAAGGAAFLSWVLPVDWTENRFLVLFGSLDTIDGPFGLGYHWLGHLPAVAGVLGAGASTLGLLFLRRRTPPRGLVAAAAAVLALGTAFLVAWLIAPPDFGGSDVTYSWVAYAGTAAVGVAAAAAAVLTRSSHSR